MATRANRRRFCNAEKLGRSSTVTDPTASGRAVASGSGLYRLLMTGRGRFLLICILAVVVGVGVAAGYVFGVDLIRRDLAATRQQLEILQPENQRLKSQIIDQNSRLVALQAKLAGVQAALDAIMPSENSYNISPNQSMIVAGGRLTIGLIGPPANDSININVNGKQQSASPGDVIKIALDPSTTCQIGVQSFDMFKAVVTASCTAARQQ